MQFKKSWLSVTLSHDIFGDVTYYAGGLWDGDKKLIKICKVYDPEDVPGYTYDQTIQYCKWLCKMVPGLKIVNEKTTEHEYPDDTIF